MLFYVRKGSKFSVPNPPSYYAQQIKEENDLRIAARKNYDFEQQCLIINYFETTGFSISKDGIIEINQKLSDLTKSIKIMFEDKLSEVIYEITDAKVSKPISLIKFFQKEGGAQIILTGKIELNELNLKKSFNELGITHLFNLLIINENDTSILDSVNNVTGDAYDFLLEPINFKLSHLGKETNYGAYGAELFPTFKSRILQDLGLTVNDHQLILKNNSKSINIDAIAFDAKKDCWLNVKQLRLPDKLVTVSRISGTKTLEEQADVETINLYVKIQGSEEVYTIEAAIGLKFKELFDLVLKKLDLPLDGEYRFRKEMTNKIVFKEAYSTLISTDPVFVEGGVRLTVEFGETYGDHEMLIKILIENALNLSDPHNQEIIVLPTTKLDDIKAIICKKFELRPEKFKFFKTDWLSEPTKEFKNENLSFKDLKIQDGECIYLKDTTRDLTNVSFIKFYINSNDFLFFKASDKIDVATEPKKNQETIPLSSEISADDALAIQNLLNEDLEVSNSAEIAKLTQRIESLDFVFHPVSDKHYRFCIEFAKDTKIKQIKSHMISLMKDTVSYSESNIRLRVISNRMEPQTILPSGSTIKKLNLASPITLLVEVLDKGDTDLNSKQVQLFLFRRKEKTYIEKTDFIFNFKDAPSFSSLYDQIKSLKGITKEFEIAKYQKPFYSWERIGPHEENLKKSAVNLKDGDFISYCIEEDSLNNDWKTEEDQLILKYLQPNLSKEKEKKYKKDKEPTLKLSVFT